MNDSPVLSQSILELASQLAVVAGELISSRGDDDLELRYKSHLDPVTKYDLAAEELIIEGILAKRPSDGIVGEEATRNRAGTSGVEWVIDPIDGTLNYSKNNPSFCVSIAAKHNEETIVGVVYAPATNELFEAERGQPPTLNSAKFGKGHAEQLEDAVIGFNSGAKPEVRAVLNNSIMPVHVRASRIRIDGSAALTICRAAAGHIDGCIVRHSNEWDYAAAALIAEAAGLTCSNFNGGPADGDAVIVAPNEWHRELLECALPGRPSGQ